MREVSRGGEEGDGEALRRKCLRTGEKGRLAKEGSEKMSAASSWKFSR